MEKMEKMCMCCYLLKPVRKESDDNKSHNPNQIHEYNYSCYECLNKIKNSDFLYKQLKIMGIIESP